MSGALARWRAAGGPPVRVVWADELEPAQGPAGEVSPAAAALAARALEAAKHGDIAGAGRVVDRMLADPWWGPVVEAAVYRALGRDAG